MTDQPTTKRCKGCRLEKPLDQFHRHKGCCPLNLANYCKPCASARAKARYAANPEPAKRRGRRFYELNSDHVRQRVRRYERESQNSPKVKERQAAYRRENRDRLRSYHKAWRDSHPENQRVYVKSKRAKRKNLVVAFTAQDWQIALAYFGGRCAACGRPPGLWHTLAQDHWVPECQGGSYTPDNIVPLCHARKGGEAGCNNLKGGLDAEQWLAGRFGRRQASAILARIEAYFQWVKTQPK
jgi:hypothetical protein